MLRDVILGLMRDGRACHGYQLMVEYRRRTGSTPGPGNFYRELGELVRRELIEPGPNPPGSDPRRRSYRIGKKGGVAFDQWLSTARRRDRDIWERLLFLDRLSTDARDRLLRSYESILVAELKAAETAGATFGRPIEPSGPFCDLAPLINKRRIRALEADLQFVRETRAEIDAKAQPEVRACRERSRAAEVAAGEPRRRVAR